jgi:hypothetical protein
VCFSPFAAHLSTGHGAFTEQNVPKTIRPKSHAYFPKRLNGVVLNQAEDTPSWHETQLSKGLYTSLLSDKAIIPRNRWQDVFQDCIINATT